MKIELVASFTNAPNLLYNMKEFGFNFTKVRHRVRTSFHARLAFTIATFNALVQWHGLQPNASVFVPLSMAEFSL